MEIKKPMALKIEPTKSGGYEIWLDDKKLHHVESYKIESSPYGKTAELSIKMSVRYPVSQENVSKQRLLQLPEE